MDFEKKINAAEIFQALSNPLRLKIVLLLGSSNKLSVTDIYTNLNIKQAVASHQLNILKNKGVLLSERKGKKTFYSLKHNQILDAIDLVTNI